MSKRQDYNRLEENTASFLIGLVVGLAAVFAVKELKKKNNPWASSWSHSSNPLESNTTIDFS